MTLNNNLLSDVRNEHQRFDGAAADGKRLFLVCSCVLVESPTVHGHPLPLWSPQFHIRISHLPSEQESSSEGFGVLIRLQLQAKPGNSEKGVRKQRAQQKQKA